MELNWTKDRHGNRVASIEHQGKKILIRAYLSGAYEALCIIGQSVFGRLSTTTYFSGVANSVLQAQKICEEKLEELTKKVAETVQDPALKEIKENVGVPFITIADGICTLEVPKGSEVRYTTNGKDVKKSNRLFEGPFKVEEGVVIKARAYFEDGTVSVQIQYPEKDNGRE